MMWEEIRQRIYAVKTLEDIEFLFREVFNLPGRESDFQSTLIALQNGEDPVYTKELAQYFESLDTPAAIQQVGQYFGSAFPKWRKNPQSNLPLLVLDRKVGEEIAAKCQVVLLSPHTLKKQNAHHPELTQADYEKAQDAVVKGEKIKQDARNLAFVINSAEGVVVVVKATRFGDELYATSIRRMSGKNTVRDRTIRKLRKGKK